MSLFNSLRSLVQKAMPTRETITEITRDGAVATIWMNRPEVHNAFDETLIADLTAACQQLDADDSVRAVIVTGAGDRAFCAGADLTPSVMRAVGSQIADGGRHITVFVCRSQSVQLLRDVARSARLAAGTVATRVRWSSLSLTPSRR